MKSVPVAAFKDKVSEFIAEVQSGGEVMITKHGKPAARLVPVESEKRAKQKAAVENLFALGRELRAKYGAVSSEQIRAWIEEDRP